MDQGVLCGSDLVDRLLQSNQVTSVLKFVSFADSQGQKKVHQDDADKHHKHGENDLCCPLTEKTVTYEHIIFTIIIDRSIV